MNDFIDEELGRVKNAYSARGRLTIATSGTAAALVSAAEDRDLGDHATQAQVARLAKKLGKLKRTERERIHGINPKRSEIIIAGAAVYSRIMSTLGVRTFRYSPLGLRDGILAQMAADYDARSRTHRQVESERRDAVLELCKRYKVDMVNSEHVTELALGLFRQLKRVHALPA